MRLRFAQEYPRGVFPAWGTVDLKGPYPTLPSQEDYTVITPNGETPIEEDILTHRYHHHTQVAVGAGRVWVAYTSSGTNEDAGGQMGVVSSSPLQATLSFGSPVLVVPPQSTWSATGATWEAGTRCAFTRCFVPHDGDLYVVFGIDNMEGGNVNTGLALVAAKCNADGTVGGLFRITSQTYTPLSGFSSIDYDATLGPALYPFAKLYGVYGGSSPSVTQSDWLGWTAQDGVNFTHPCTFPIDDDGGMVRLWRRVTDADNYLWGQVSRDGGASWSKLVKTSIPDSPACTAAIRMSDGRIAMVGNPHDNSVQRDPLYLAIFEDLSKARIRLYAVRQGLSATPTYAGTFKSGGAAYPGICEYDGHLYISYSMQKETIGLTRVSISAI